MSTGPTFAGLLASELRRTLARRLVRLLVLIAVTGITVAGVVVFLHSTREPSTATALVPGVRSSTGSGSGCVPVTTPPEPGEQSRFVIDGPGVGKCIVRASVPRDRRFHYARLWRNDDPILAVLAAPLILAAIVAAASLVGAEWKFATLGVLLTWEPRRARVLLTKALAAVIAAFCIAFLLEAFLALALAPAALWHGTTAGVDAAWWRGAAGLAARIAGVTALFSVVGMALGSIGRSTTGAIAVALGYGMVGEAALHALRPKWEHWLVVPNIATVVTESGRPMSHHGAGIAAILLVGYAAALGAIALLLFMRRDVA